MIPVVCNRNCISVFRTELLMQSLPQMVSPSHTLQCCPFVSLGLRHRRSTMERSIVGNLHVLERFDAIHDIACKHAKTRETILHLHAWRTRPWLFQGGCSKGRSTYHWVWCRELPVPVPHLYEKSLLKLGCSTLDSVGSSACTLICWQFRWFFCAGLASHGSPSPWACAWPMRWRPRRRELWEKLWTWEKHLKFHGYHQE